MAGFSKEWLALRHPADLRARHIPVINDFIHWIRAKERVDTPLILADIGAGTGATVAAFETQTQVESQWHLFDVDANLLKVAKERFGPEQILETCTLDFGSSVMPVLDHLSKAERPIGGLTCSALLDLVSEDWIDDLVDRLAEKGLPFYGALSFDGRMSITPTNGGTGKIFVAVREHQGGDKGFGPALGPKAGAHAIERFKAKGFLVKEGPSDWVIHSDEREFALELIKGWHHAACEILTSEKAELDEWLQYTEATLSGDHWQIMVGHVDFCALPPKP